MKSDFETSPRILAFPAIVLDQVSALTEAYGAALPLVPKKPDSPLTVCLAGGLDREGSDDLRALDFPTTANTTALTDGRHAYMGYWSKAAIAAVNNGDVEAEELTLEQLQSLTPVPEL